MTKSATPRADRDDAADSRRECSDQLADRRRKNVDAAHDQHVVGAPDAADARTGAPAAAGARPQPHVIAAAEAQEWRGFAIEMRIDQLTLCSISKVNRVSAFRIDQFEMHETASRKMHALL